jgi:hypothetical protein
MHLATRKWVQHNKTNNAWQLVPSSQRSTESSQNIGAAGLGQTLQQESKPMRGEITETKAKSQKHNIPEAVKKQG